MIDAYAVKLAIEYLDLRFKNNQPADLPEMLDHVDYYDRVVMALDEVNEVLRQRPSVYVQRVGGRVFFNQSSGDREITEADLERNIKIRTDEFWARYKELNEHRE